MSRTTGSRQFKPYLAVSVFLVMQAVILYIIVIPSHDSTSGVMLWDFYTGVELAITLLTVLLVWVYRHKDKYLYKNEYYANPLGNLVILLGGIAISTLAVLWVVWVFPSVIKLLHLN